MDDRTDHLDLPLPHPEHLMIEDVARLREALVSLDAVVSRRAHDSVAIAAGAGLTGGGTLQQSRSLAVAFATQEESEAASVSDVVMSPLRTAQAIAARLASEAEAQAGEAATRLMTPLRTRQVLDEQFLARLASQGEAQAGEDAQRLMTPLRSHQAFDARLATRLATQQQAEAGLDSTQLMTPLRVAQFHALQPKGEIQRLARTSHIKLTAAEFGRFIDITSGSFTQTFDPVATLGQGWFCYLRNSGTGDITLDPYGSETLDGLTSYVMYPGEVRLVLCDGTALRSVVLSAFYKVFTTSGSFSKPPGYIGFEVEVIGGGQGGAAGKSGYQQGGSSGTVNGAAGGVPGARRQAFVPSGRIAASITVTVGAGGLGGTTQGTSGGAGGASIFGATALLSSGSSGVPELTGIVGAGSIGGAGGPIYYTYSVANPSAAAPGAYIGSGVTIPSGGASETYGYIPNIAGTYSATGTAGQAATADFCSGAGGGTATCRMEGNNTYPSDVIVKLTAGKGGNGGIGAGGGGGGHALAIWGNGGGLSGSPIFNLTHGIGGNGGSGLVSVWGVI